MGCTASKLDGEDTVRRYKTRRRLMKEAVYARHNLAAAQADYCRSLRLTGSALSTFAAGEPLSVSYQTPAVFLHHPPPPPPSQPSPTNSNSIPPRVPPPPPPPEPPVISTSSSRRRKHQQRPKLPHILSDSSPSSSPASERSNFYPRAYQNSTYSATPSHASSVWNWENFYPPSPPDSEFFDKKAQEETLKQRQETERTEHASKNKKKNSVVDEEETEREEVQCSSWDVQDHFSSEEEDDNMESVSEIGTKVRTRHHHQQASPMPREYGDDIEDDATTFSGSYRGGGGDVAVRHRDLKEIADALKEYFDKAADAGDQVSQLLELGRAQLDGSFKQLKSEL